MKTTTEKYTFHSDPGHGWLEVELAELGELKIAHLISSYSYLHRGIVYLEEDMDLGTFRCAKEAAGQPFEIVDHYQEHTPIRAYSRYYHPDYVSPRERAKTHTPADYDQQQNDEDFADTFHAM